MYKILAYLFFILPAPVAVWAQEYNYVHYDTKDGLAGSTVYDMCQDKEGFLWFATENGLSRYDGTRFKNYTVKDGLPDNEVLKIFADSKGRLWIGTFNKEICYYYQGKIFNKFNDTLVKKIVLEGFFSTVAEDKNGNIAFCDYKKIMILQTAGNNSQVRVFRLSAKMNTYTVFVNKQWDKIVATEGDGNFFVYENNNFKFLYSYPFEPASKLSDRKFIIKIDFEKKIFFQISSKPGYINISGADNIAEFLNTTDGVWSIDTANIKYDQHFLQGKKISKTVRDKEKNLWFSSFGEGVYKLPSTETQTVKFSAAENNSGSEVFSLFKIKNDLVCGVGFSKAVVLSSNRIKKILDYGNVDAQPGFRDKANRLYSAKSLLSGITIFGFDNFLVKLEKDRSAFNFVYPIKSVEEIDRDNIIVGTSNYAFKIGVSNLQITDTIWRERCTKVFHHQKKYYIGTPNGLYEVNEDKSYKYLGDLNPSLKRRITDIKAAPDGSLWIATSDEGLVNYNTDRVTELIKDSNGLTSNICKTLFLKDQYLWVGTNKGLNKIDLSKPAHPVLKYSSSDGLPSDIINAIYEEDSIVYVGSPAGLTFFNENKISNTSVCDLRLLQVTVSGKEVPADSSYTLSYKNNNIRFEYVAISFKSGGDMVYHYKLAGLDDDWQQTTQTFLEYPSLPSGNYELQLYATNKFGVQSKTIVIRFTISTPFWKAWWFYCLLLATAIAITGWLVNARNKKLRNKLKEQNRQDKQFAALEQQALQAQMNPHFIFNCLNSIQQYILTNDKEKANEYLTGFASLIRQTLDNSGKKTISVAEEIRYLTQYLEMEKMRFADNFNYTIVAAANIDAGNIDIPALLLQPYVENCLRHGIRYKTDGKGKVDILFTIENGVLYCSITDNGVGRLQAAQYKNSGHITYQSKGMSLTEKRITLFNKMDENNIEVSITDGKDAAGNALGTVVTVKIPQ